MVKQFTVPCKFNNSGSMSPVTLYIGHPEASHHPVSFQSDWLSSTKGGVIPQDLMDTLQKLHDLALQNGADFEELCYYALISATRHGTGNGVSQSEIDKYANEFVENESTSYTDRVMDKEINNNDVTSNDDTSMGNDTTNVSTDTPDIENSNNMKTDIIGSANVASGSTGCNVSSINEVLDKITTSDSVNGNIVDSDVGSNNNVNIQTTTYTNDDQDLLLADDYLDEENNSDQIYSDNRDVDDVGGDSNEARSCDREDGEKFVDDIGLKQSDVALDTKPVAVNSDLDIGVGITNNIDAIDDNSSSAYDGDDDDLLSDE